MSNRWLHMYHQNNLSNTQLPFHLSDHDQVNTNNNSDTVSDSTVVTAAVSSATTPPASTGLNPDGSRVKPVRKRSRASRRTPTTVLNTDAANFRAMVQQFTGGPSNANNNLHNFPTFGFPGNCQALFDPAAAAYHLQDPPQQPTLFQFQSQPPPLQQPPFMFSLSNSAAGAAFFQQPHGGGSRSNNDNNINYMEVFDGSSPTPQNHRPT
ncbi:VQ motif-containing protein 22-like [Benincasa hispida]|uniref:VQ motif-containing protein 22-like n=1 Tax=Benincasa hispida TaxID=102211 RepID=UPI0018FF4539|nr:VQ motif-containing protein 22-like [Benincasa hispida]